VALHAVLIGVLVYGWLQFRHPPPRVNALAIDATVVSQATLDAAARPARPAPQPAPPASAPVEVEQPAPPPPDQAARQAAAQAEAEHAAAAEKAQQAQERASAQRAAARERADAKAAQEKAAEEKAEQERRDKAKAAEQVAARKAAEESAAKAKAAAAAKAQAAASQADLQRSIDAEERLNAARASGALSAWDAQIQARITRAWIRPPSARPGLDCLLYLTQVPGGEIVNVKLGTCNGDDAVKQSILDAAYRASPLPPPPDPSLFERNLEVTFRPTD
jgi:colicin import membrane protein